MQASNENGLHTSVNIEMENISKSQQPFQELVCLIGKSSTEYTDISSHTTKIRDLLDSNASNIFETAIKGKNIFHVIANQPDRNSDILSAFGFDNEGNSSECLAEYVSQQRTEELLYMPWGPRKRCPIHLAVANGFTQFVSEMLKICPSLISAQDGDKNTPLHIAAMSSMPEAVDCLKIFLDIMEKNQVVEEILLNTRNAKGQTPVHLVCSRVPKNKDAQVTTKLHRMLSYGCRANILKSIDNSNKTPLHLLCSKDEQPTDADRLKNVHDLLRMLIENEEIVNQPTNDEHKRTALHLLAISEFPQMTKILITQVETDVSIKDAHGKMAIHYAAMNALRPRSQECVKILADWKSIRKNMAKINPEGQDLFRNYLLWDAFVEDDGTKSTALTLACKSKSTKTVEFILRNVFEAKSNFGIWFIGNDNDQEVFSLKQVYKHTPAALEFLFDKSIRIDLENSTEIKVEFVTDISVITALGRPIQEDDSTSEMKYLGYANNWTEDIQEKLLLHPLTQCALHALWQNMLPYKLMWLILNLVWLTAYWILVPLEYSDADGKFMINEVVAAWVLAVLSILYLVDELITIKFCIKRLVSQEMNAKMIWIQMFLTLAVVYGPCLQSVGVLANSPPNNVEKLCASGGVLLSFIIFWRNIGIIYLPLGIHVEYLIQTLQKILESFICIAAIIIGFQKAFIQILPHEFPSTTWSFTKTLVMMTGEFDFGEMYEMYKGEDQANNDTLTSVINWTLVDYGTWNLLMFIVFLIILPVTFYNLVTGVVVDKIKSMESKLEMYQIRSQIRHINYIQKTIVSKFVFLAPCFDLLLPCFLSYRRTKNGEVIIDHEVKWYAEKGDEPSLLSIFCNTLRQLFSCCHRGVDDNNVVLCGNFLSNNLRNRMFQIYEEKLEESETMQNNYSEIEYV